MNATAAPTDDRLLADAETGILSFLDAELAAGRIAKDYHEKARSAVIPNLRRWMLDPHIDRISPNLKTGVREAIRAAKWERLLNAYVRNVNFGTGGIREKMGFERDDVLRLKAEGLGAPILKGPNTMNDVVLMLTTVGVAKFARERKLDKIVVGFDSRVRGADFARMIAEVLLAFDCVVHLFDEACMYPSVTFAVPTLRADIGIFISASHNDFRYNGFKLSCGNGSQFSAVERNELFDKYIAVAQPADVQRRPLAEAGPENVWWLGGSAGSRTIADGLHKGLPLGEPLPGFDYGGRTNRIVDLHSLHVKHIMGFVLRPEICRNAAKPLSVGYSAFNGSGRKAVPRLLNEVGITDVKRINVLDPLDGMFPAFCSDPGKEQQPDPGDRRAADIAVAEFRKQYSAADWDKLDILIGTDPDSDRCGIIVKVPPAEQPHFEGKDYFLLPADDAWTLLLWYQLQFDVEKHGAVRDADKKFIVLSHTTTDALARTARKFGLGVVKTWVGFAQLATGTQAAWKGEKLPKLIEGRVNSADPLCSSFLYDHDGMDTGRRSINFGAFEQSNGYSLLGGPPKDAFSLGAGGHVRDKDGAFAALLVAEVAQYAKSQGTTLMELVNERIYCDPAIGLFVNYYEPDPLDGEYPGLKGDSDKRTFLMKAIELFESGVQRGVKLGGAAIVGAAMYQTGKYDRVNWKGFPDEGVRLYFDSSKLDHLTIRPSGTSNALRFHVQLHADKVSRDTLAATKAELRRKAKAIVDGIRHHTGALIDRPL